MEFLKIKDLCANRELRFTSLLIFIILCANKFDIQLTGGEEQYVAFAKHWANPNWIPGSFSLEEFAGTRFLFQLINAPFAYFATMEWLALGGRLITFFLMSIPLALIFRKLRFHWVFVLFIMQLFVMSKQSFFAGEWIFDGYEPKAIAYIFLFYGLYHALENNLRKASFHLAVSTAFHVLIGGWFFFLLSIIFLFQKRQKLLRQFILPYVLLLLPLGTYLFYGYFAAPVVETDLDLNRIYCYYRLPHHCGIFYSVEYFIKHHLEGVLISTGVLAISLVFRRFIPQNLKLVAQIMYSALSLNLIFVGAAWLDTQVMDYQLSGLLKFYPFRTNSLAMLCFFWILGSILWERIIARRKSTWVSRTVIVVSVGLLISQLINSVVMFQNPKIPDGFVAMCDYIEANTEQDDSFILINIPVNQRSQYQFIRHAQRESFCVNKFVSAEKGKLAEWYARQKLMGRINKDNSLLLTLSDQYDVDYVLSDSSIEDLKLVHQQEELYLYSLKSEHPDP